MEADSVDSQRERILEEIAIGGMPAAVRPLLRGERKVIDPAVKGNELAVKEGKSSGMEDRLATMLVKCVEEKVAKSEGKVLERMERIEKMILLQSQGREREGRTAAPPETTKKKAAPGETPKGKGKKPVTKAQPPLPVPTETGGSTPAWSQVLGRKAAAAASPPAGTTQQQRVPPKEQRREVQTPPNGSAKEGEWTQVRRKKERSVQNRAQSREQVAHKATKSDAKSPGQGGKAGGKNKNQNAPQQEKKTTTKRRVPRTAAVTLTCPDGDYAENMGTVRRKIDLGSLGIVRPPNVRRTATGALSLEITGQGNAEKADALAAKMAEALAGKEGVKVSRPSMTADLRLMHFEESVTGTEIAETLAKRGGIGIMEITVGPIRKMERGLCSTVVKCPLAMANRLAREGKVALGWSPAKVEMLEKRPLQCYKCLEFGHTRATCRNEVDHTGACYRCGETGHSTRDCRAPMRCVVCLGKGLPHEHRIGGSACKGCKAGRKGRAADKEREGKEKTAMAEKEGKPRKDKGYEKPKKTSVCKAEGFRVTAEGKVIAGVVHAPEPPKEQRPPKRKKEEEKMKMKVRSKALREVGEVTLEEPPREQRPPKRKKEVDKVLRNPEANTMAMAMEADRGAEIPPPGPFAEEMGEEEIPPTAPFVERVDEEETFPEAEDKEAETGDNPLQDKKEEERLEDLGQGPGYIG